MGTAQYTINLQKYRQLTTLGVPLVCYTCRKKIEIGDVVYSKSSRNARQLTKLRHVECAKRVNML